MKNPETTAVEVMKQFCSECYFGSNCTDRFNEQLHIDRYVKIRHDGLPSKERCPDFSHKCSPRKKKEDEDD